MKKKLRFNPWFSMWTRPRSTIAAIVKHNPRHLVILLAMISGILETFDRAATHALGDTLSVSQIFVIAIVVGAISGVIGLYFFGWLLTLTGKWIGGKAPQVNVRAAIAWSSVPLIWAGLLWIPEMLIFGREIFTGIMLRTPLNPAPLMLLLFFSLIEVVVAVWAFVIYLKALGEVQGFSAWKALLNAAIAFAITIGALLVVLLPFILLRASSMGML